jgi:hypothetical protein
MVIAELVTAVPVDVVVADDVVEVDVVVDDDDEEGKDVEVAEELVGVEEIVKLLPSPPPLLLPFVRSGHMTA